MIGLSLNLKKLMKLREINPSELARQTGVAQPIIHRIASGKNTNPKLETLKPLAAHFRVSLSELIGDAMAFDDTLARLKDESMEKNPNSGKDVLKMRSDCRCRVPLLSWEAVSRWLDCAHDEGSQTIDSSRRAIPTAVCEPAAYRLTDRAVTSRAYALTLNYDVMVPLLSSGTVLIVEPARAPVSRDRVIVQIGDDPVACLKQWQVTQTSGVMLQSVNPVLMPLAEKPLTDQVRVLGVVVQCILTLHPSI